MHTIYAIVGLVLGGLGLLIAFAGRPRLAETFDAVILVLVGIFFWALASTIGHWACRRSAPASTRTRCCRGAGELSRTGAGRDFLTIRDYAPAEIGALLDPAIELKAA